MILPVCTLSITAGRNKKKKTCAAGIKKNIKYSTSDTKSLFVHLYRTTVIVYYNNAERLYETKI